LKYSYGSPEDVFCKYIWVPGDVNGVITKISANGDQGADPNKLVRVTDVLAATTPPTGGPAGPWGDRVGKFRTIRAARAGEVLRGIAFAPGDQFQF